MRHTLLLFLLGCSAPSKPMHTASTELNPSFSKVEPWLNDPHWLGVDGAMYGVWFTQDSFTIHVVDDGEGAKPADGILRFIAIDNGRSYAERRDLGDAELAAFGHIEGGQMTRAPAPALEAADRAFAADTKARGVDGWLAAFDPHGGMMRKGNRIEGDAIKDQMKDLLAEGVLAWDPIASGAHGDLGFTVGKATYTPTKPEDQHWASTYMTIWHHQPDGSWKVLFDTGRVVNR
jgi:ketosteroid isomerase-like protein